MFKIPIGKRPPGELFSETLQRLALLKQLGLQGTFVLVWLRLIHDYKLPAEMIPYTGNYHRHNMLTGEAEELFKMLVEQHLTLHIERRAYDADGNAAFCITIDFRPRP
jgi:hypothetical protein